MRETEPGVMLVAAGLVAFAASFVPAGTMRAEEADPSAKDRAPVVHVEGAPRIESYYEYHSFRFSSDVPGSPFHCSLDDEHSVPCKSGAYRYVPFGRHVFRVYAVSPDGIRGEAAIVEYESRDPNWD